jgi:hypothetical protein
MRYAALLVMAGLVTGPALAADCAVKPTKLEALGDTVGLFDENGKFLEEVPKAALEPGVTLLSCNENLGLMQVSLANGEVKWLDRAELRLTFPDGAARGKVCVVAASSRAADHTEAAVAGVDPDNTKDCVPAAPAKP